MDMHGKVVLITGANSGIGLGTAIQLAERGSEVVMVCRDPVRGQFMRKEVEEYATGPNPLLFLADLSCQTDIHALAGQLQSRLSRIDVLINNAGIMRIDDAALADTKLRACRGVIHVRRRCLRASPAHRDHSQLQRVSSCAAALATRP